MNVSPINNAHQKSYKKINCVNATGYSALALGAVSIVQASRHKIKSHKTFAWLSALSTLAHVGILEYFKFKN